MDASFNELTADEFFAASRPHPDQVLRGAELEKVFWRFKGLDKELERQKAFWRSTNETLSHTLAQVRATEEALQQKNELLSASYEQLHALTNRLQSELALARQIQQSLLPPRHAAWHGPMVTCACIPAYEVGGDFYNYHTLSDHRFALAVGDVSDKGMSAALLMAISVAFFDADVTFNLPPAELLSYLDRALMRYTRATRQNCAMCYVELQDRTLHSANAGGIAPFIRRANSVERLDVSGFPLGVGIGAERGYQSVTVDLDPGDLVRQPTGCSALSAWNVLSEAVRHSRTRCWITF
jgi:serine phosphatase RsbU (regulator of sigma subunit)